MTRRHRPPSDWCALADGMSANEPVKVYYICLEMVRRRIRCKFVCRARFALPIRLLCRLTAMAFPLICNLVSFSSLERFCC